MNATDTEVRDRCSSCFERIVSEPGQSKSPPDLDRRRDRHRSTCLWIVPWLGVSHAALCRQKRLPSQCATALRLISSSSGL